MTFRSVAVDTSFNRAIIYDIHYIQQLTILQLHEGRTLLGAGGPGPEDLQRKYFHI